MKVKFLKTRAVQDSSGTVFEEGCEYDLPEASAKRWISRRLAVAVVDGPAGNPADKMLVGEKPKKKAESEPTEAPAVEAAEVPESGHTPHGRSKPDALKSSDIKKQ